MIQDPVFDGWMLAIEPAPAEVVISEMLGVEQLRARVTVLSAGLRTATSTLEGLLHAGILYDQEWLVAVREAACGAHRLAELCDET